MKPDAEADRVLLAHLRECLKRIGETTSRRFLGVALAFDGVGAARRPGFDLQRAFGH